MTANCTNVRPGKCKLLGNASSWHEYTAYIIFIEILRRSRGGTFDFFQKGMLLTVARVGASRSQRFISKSFLNLHHSVCFVDLVIFAVRLRVPIITNVISIVHQMIVYHPSMRYLFPIVIFKNLCKSLTIGSNRI